MSETDVFSFDEPQQLFERYFKVGSLVSGVVEIQIYRLDSTTLQAFGTAEKTAFGFSEGEQVVFNHLGDEVWRVTSDANDHGHPVFLGEDYDGISIGS